MLRKRWSGLAVLGALILLSSPALSQDGPPDLDFQMKVDKAIEKGIAYLKGKSINNPGGHQKSGDELILLTYVHAGNMAGNAHYEKLLKEALGGELVSTYRTALVAMSLEEIQRVKYQWRIHQCAQFLVDNMTRTGVLRYGAPVDLSDIPREESPDVKTMGNAKEERPAAHGGKPDVVKRIPVKQRPNKRPKEAPGAGNADHDMSNMQYLALGLRSCHDAGIVFPKQLIAAFRAFWIKMQLADKGAKPELLIIDLPKKSSSGFSTRAKFTVRATPRGWGYQKTKRNYPYGSMTVGGVGAICIADYMLKVDWRRDQAVLDGLQWMAKHFTLKENPEADKEHQKFLYYYLYGMERAGMLFGTETIGNHKWYREGAEYLLKEQSSKGSWSGSDKPGAVVDTCFAILFLKRATRSLPVATGGGRR